jgi:hypothetical protein
MYRIECALNKAIAEVGLTYVPRPLRQNHVTIHSDWAKHSMASKRNTSTFMSANCSGSN